MKHNNLHRSGPRRLEDYPPGKQAPVESLRAAQLVAQYRAATIPLDKYLEDGGPISDGLLESIDEATPVLQIVMNIWKRKHGLKSSRDLSYV